MISNTIETLRKEKKISVTDVADRLGITVQGYYQLIKRGDFKVSQLENIAEALGVDVSYFIGNPITEKLLEFLKTGINDEIVDTWDNPVSWITYNYICKEYVKSLFSYLGNVIPNYKDEWSKSFIKNYTFVLDTSKNPISNKIKEVLKDCNVREKFLSEFENNNDKFVNSIYKNELVIYLIGQEIITYPLLSNILRQVLFQASDFVEK